MWTSCASLLMWTAQHRQCGRDRISDFPVPIFRYIGEETPHRGPWCLCRIHLKLQCSLKFTNRECIQAVGFALVTFLGILGYHKSIFSTFTKILFLAPTWCPEFTNETMMTDPEKLLNRSVYRARPMKSAWGTDPWLSPRLAWQLQLAQESKAGKTNTKNHRLSQIITSLEL